jgi:arginase family enzyme
MDYPLDPGLIWPSPRSFFGAPRCDDLSTLAADVAFVGVPYDAGTLQPYIRTGQSGGPAVARLSSVNQLDYNVASGSAGGERLDRLVRRGDQEGPVGRGHHGGLRRRGDHGRADRGEP